MKYALTYGLLSGLVIILTMLAGIVWSEHGSFFSSELFGYLVMLVALTFIFVGVKRYRDIERGGVVTFARAFGLGLSIAIVAGLTYALVWEIYLASTNLYVHGQLYRRDCAREAERRGCRPPPSPRIWWRWNRCA